MSKYGNLDVYDNCKSSLYRALKTILDFPIGPKYLEMIDFRWLNITSPTSEIIFFKFKETKQIYILK